MLVAFGEFVQQHGLLERLRQVPIGQKTLVFTPQAKLIEFLAGITRTCGGAGVSGIEHLEDLNFGPHPLVRDRCVAQAWGQERFAHYSSVSRTLKAGDDQTVAAVEAAITAFSRPFIEASVSELLRRGQPLVYDFDLTGQAVSSTSTTYPEAAFGSLRVNDQVRLGYPHLRWGRCQLARVCLSPRTDERVWLAGFHHPGDTVSAACLQELLRAAEAQTGVRPRRRPELVAQRIEGLQAVMERTRRLIAQQQLKLNQLGQTQATLIGKCYHAEQVQKGPIPAGKLAHLQKQVASWHKRQPRLIQQITLAERVLAEHRARLVEQESQLAELRAWQAQLTADNQANPDPPPHIEARMDAGFASGENLTWLVEMGYWPDTKAPNGRTTTVLRAELPRSAAWQAVGDNAEMVLIGEHGLYGCPYPLSLAVERFKIGSHFKYATLIRYGPAPKLAAWFAHYNARQTIEAGNKELKGTFHVQHLMSHSPAGIRLQVVFTGLAANIARWCRPWLQTCAAEPTPTVIRMLTSTKHLVRVAANSAALVQRTSAGLGLLFAPASALPGAIFTLRGIDAFQLPLGFHRPIKITTDSTKVALVAQNLR